MSTDIFQRNQQCIRRWRQRRQAKLAWLSNCPQWTGRVRSKMPKASLARLTALPLFCVLLLILFRTRHHGSKVLTADTAE